MAFITFNYFSSCLKRTVTANAIIPADKTMTFGRFGKKKEFKTLYLLHGLLGDCNDWALNTPLRLLAESKDLAVILPSGENGFYLNLPHPGADYEDFIAKELIEVTRRLFPLSRKREDTFIGGLSMGGYGALRLGLKYHKTFSHILAFSSAVHVFEGNDNGNEFHSLFGDLKKAKRSDMNPRVCFLKMEKSLHGNASRYPHIYLSCARQDGLYEANVSFRDFLLEHQADVTWDEEDGGHDWDFWRSQIEKAIETLPLGQSEQGIGSGNVK